jgi:hypothetical protein
MNDTPDTAPREKRHAGGELVIPVLALLFTIYYFVTIIDVPWTAQVSALFVGSILIVLIIVFLVKTMKEVRAGKTDLGMQTLVQPVSFIPKRLVLFAITLGFILLVEHLGFTITSFLFLCSAMMLLDNGRRKVLAVSVAAILSLAGWALFIWAFETRFPAGPFENLMKSVL